MKTIKYISLLIFILFSVSCGKDFKDINVDPNNPGKVPAEFLFTSATKFFADQNNGCDQAFFGWLWGQYLMQNNYTEASRYATSEGGIYKIWKEYYADALYDLQEVIKITNAHPGLNEAVDKNKKAIATILSSMIFQDLSDIFGPVPYKEALLGKVNKTPKYDSQKDIYIGLLQDLKDAIAQLDINEASFGSADPIYNGKVENWRKFANTLRMRIAIRMADVEPEIAKAEILNAYQEGAFNTNLDNAYFHYLASQPNNNSFNQCRVDRFDADIGMSNILIDKTLVALNDPRLAAFADKSEKDGKYTGRLYGQESNVAAGDSPDNYSQPSGAAIIRHGEGNFNEFDVVKPDALGRIMSYAEVCFILAESTQRWNNIPGSAEEWYNKGVEASIEEWGIKDPSTISNYLVQQDVKYNPANWSQVLGVQKWIALFMQGNQGWTEWRRLDFVKLEPPYAGILNDPAIQIAPFRLTYPVTEQTQNGSNYSIAINQLGVGGDKLSTRLWWDVK